MRSHGVVRGGIIVPVIIPPVVDVLVVPVVEDVLVAALGLPNQNVRVVVLVRRSVVDVLVGLALSFRPEREARAPRFACVEDRT